MESFWEDMQDRVGRYRREHLFFTPTSLSGELATVTNADVLLGKLALIGSEVGEAIEAVRDHNLEELTEELADIVIRIMDIGDALDLNIWNSINIKMDYNEKRPKRHGRKTTI
jgi:NTP pyrophosphatase (non-canonical NTP hydrolase)